MSREKQIEEMAKILSEDCGSCESCMALGSTANGIDCTAYYYARNLYNAGYRKQSENVVEVVRCRDCKFNVANMERDPLDITDYSGDDIVCSYLMADGLDPMDYCSCGSKMKGENQ